MLSAFAARKLAQAVPRDPTVPPSQPQKPDAAREHPSSLKRKQSTSTHVLKPLKRKKKNTRTPPPPHTKSPQRRAESDSFKAQEEIIVIDDDDDSDEEIRSEDSGSGDVGEEEEEWSRRGFDLEDSSDEEDDGALNEEDDNGPSNPVSTGQATQEGSPPTEIRMLKPYLNQNVFHLDPGEVAPLRPSHETGTGTGASIIALQRGESACLFGAYSVTVIQGSGTLYGSILPSSLKSHRVFSPRSSPLPLITGDDVTGAVSTLHSLPQRLHYLISAPITLIIVQELRTGIEGLGRICRTFDGVFKPPRGDHTTFPLQIDGVFLVPSSNRDFQILDVSESWKTGLSLSSLPVNSSPGVYLVRGPKNTGKSTFARLLVNTLLNRYQRVAYLECDLGQSEFTPGGMVALNIVSQPIFGPSFTHPTLPNYAHYIGATTPRSSPSHYLSSIQSLLEIYRLDIKTPIISQSTPDHDDERISDSIPLVINTMGWTKGLGGDLSLKIEAMAEPTDIYEMEQPPDAVWLHSPSNNINPSILPLQVPQSSKVHRLRPAPSSTLWTNYTAADHRSLSIISYFHAVFSVSPPQLTTSTTTTTKTMVQEEQEEEEEFQQVTALSWRTSLPLCHHPPYEVDPSKAFDKIILTGANSEDVVPSEINRVLNGALVGLVSCQPGALDHSGGIDNETPLQLYIRGDPPPSPPLSTCRGLALVRSTPPPASSQTHTHTHTHMHMHILTPLPVHLLGGTRVLVKGELEIPIWEMLDFGDEDDAVAGVEKGRVPYLQWGKGDGVGGERRRIRRNLMRRGQM